MLKNKHKLDAKARRPIKYNSIQATDPWWRKEVAYWWGKDMKNSIALPFVHDNYSYSKRHRGKSGFWLYT